MNGQTYVLQIEGRLFGEITVRIGNQLVVDADTGKVEVFGYEGEIARILWGGVYASRRS